MCFSSPSAPSPAPAPPPPPPIVRQPSRRQATLATEGVAVAREDERSRAQLAFARRGGTLITGPGGLTSQANTQKVTLLGQV
jgi:hypothetical protein